MRVLFKVLYWQYFGDFDNWPLDRGLIVMQEDKLNLQIQSDGSHIELGSYLRYTGKCSRPSCRYQSLPACPVGSLYEMALEVLRARKDKRIMLNYRTAFTTN